MPADEIQQALITLIVSASIMTKPLILLDPQAGKPSVSEELNESLWGSVVKLFKFRVFVHPTKEQDDTQYLDMAYLVSDLRRIYFYDSVHNVTLLIGFVLSVFSILKISIGIQKSHLVWIDERAVIIYALLCPLLNRAASPS